MYEVGEHVHFNGRHVGLLASTEAIGPTLRPRGDVELLKHGEERRLRVDI